MQKFASTLHFSSSFALVQAIMLLGSVGGVLCLSFAVGAKILLMVGLLGYSLRNIYQYSQWDAIGCDTDGWYFVRNNEKFSMSVTGDSTVTPWVSVIRFYTLQERGKQSYLIFKDAMPAGLYRQFTVNMRCSEMMVSHSKIR